MELLNDTRNRSGYAKVAGVDLRYNISQKTGGQVSNVSADVLKNEIKFGGITIERDGRMYISFDKTGIVTAAADQIAIISQAINDAAEVFNEKIPE